MPQQRMTPHSPAPQEPVLAVTDRVWRMFASMRTGLWLLALVAVASLIGTVIPQQLPPQYYHPMFYKLYQLFGLTDLYHSLWFRLLLGLLCLNILICTIQRFPGLWRQTVEVPVTPSREQLQAWPCSRTVHLPAPADTALKQAENLLKQKGFRVTPGDGGQALYAQRGRFAPWGTLAVHVSVLVIVLGALWGNFRGFSADLLLPVGGSYAVDMVRHPGVRAAFTIRVNDFRTEYYPQGGVSDWISDVSIFEGDKEVARQEVKVNHPLEYGGTRMYQSSYGTGVMTTLYNAHGSVIKSGMVPEQDFFTVDAAAGIVIQPVKYVPDFDPHRPGMTKSQEPRNPRILYIIYSAGRETDWGAAVPGEKIGLPKEEGFVSFDRVVPYTGLQLKRDPGVAVVWAGFILMTLGFFVSLYTRPMQLWVVCASGPQGHELTMAGRSPRDTGGLNHTCERLMAELVTLMKKEGA